MPIHGPVRISIIGSGILLEKSIIATGIFLSKRSSGDNGSEVQWYSWTCSFQAALHINCLEKRLAVNRDYIIIVSIGEERAVLYKVSGNNW